MGIIFLIARHTGNDKRTLSLSSSSLKCYQLKKRHQGMAFNPGVMQVCCRIKNDNGVPSRKRAAFQKSIAKEGWIVKCCVSHTELSLKQPCIEQ